MLVPSDDTSPSISIALTIHALTYGLAFMETGDSPKKMNIKRILI
jgi:hypothetical protein